MASKSKKRSRSRGHKDPLVSVKLKLDRGDYKQALKEARVAFRQSAGGEERCFLEHAYAGRVQQLVRNGLLDDGRRILRELLDLGVTEQSVEVALPELLLSVGMLDGFSSAQFDLTEEDQLRLRIKAADQAVVHPENTPASMGELRAEAAQVRAALEATKLGDESAALTHVKEITRQSMFADWKYFVRGLLAYYHQDKRGMEANWSRLDPHRAAATIAAPLGVVAGLASAAKVGNLRAKVAKLEKQAGDRAVLGSLMQLRQSVANHDWPQAVKAYRNIRPALRDLDSDLCRRVTSCLSGTIIREGCLDELTALTKVAEAPAIDPRWNRAKALACEHSEYFEDQPAPYWRRYLHDLKTLSAFTPAQRDMARGLVWLRLAEGYAEDAQGFRLCLCSRDHSREIAAADEAARDAFEACLALIPSNASAIKAAAWFHEEAGRPEEAVKVYERLLEHVPDSLDALVYLAEHYLHHGAQKACEYALRARELKPLDENTGELLWSAHANTARELARAGRHDEARDALAAADVVLPSRAEHVGVLVQRAVLEIAAKNAGVARGYVEQAQDQLEEPTALWLALAIESSRHESPLEEIWLYEKRWRQALKRRCRSSTAGEMCRLMTAQERMPCRYREFDEHVSDLLKYVGRCSRVKWQEEDLRVVCEFAAAMEQWKLLEKFAKKGGRTFPRNALFQHACGVEEMRKGPMRFNRRRTIERFQRAIELASESSDPRDEVVGEQAKRYLALAENAPPSGIFQGNRPSGATAQRMKDMADKIDPEKVREVVETVCAELGLDAEAMVADFDAEIADRAG